MGSAQQLWRSQLALMLLRTRIAVLEQPAYQRKFLRGQLTILRNLSLNVYHLERDA